MKSLATLLVLIISLGSLRAQDPTPIKLTVSDVVDLSSAINALDVGYTKLIKPDGRPEKDVQLPYDLGAARLTLARNLGAITPDVDAYNKARAAILKEIWGDRVPGGEKDPEENAKWKAKIQPVIETVIEVKLTKIKTDDLKLATNPIPIAILKALAPILEP